MEDKAKLWMYKNEYKNADNHPDRTGTGEIPRDVLKKFVERTKSSGEDSLKLRCAAWERTSKNGNPYFFITMEIDEKPKPSGGKSSEDLPW